MVLKELVTALLSLSEKTEFWSAIAGAIVGGLIALVIQIVTLRASKKQRDEDDEHWATPCCLR